MAQPRSVEVKQVASRDSCEVHVINADRVREARDSMPAEDVVMRLSETFRVLGDPTRAKIVHALSEQELCVCDLAVLLGVTSSAVSHQLRILRNLRLVKHRREGQVIYYSLDDDHVIGLFHDGLEHVLEE